MEDNRNYNLEFAKYIWSILRSNLVILMSWGVEFSSIKVINKGIEFHVQGFIHTGKIQIMLNEGTDLFEIILIADSGEIVKMIEDIYIDMLVSVIDENIEKTENYKERISKEYGFATET